MRLLAAIALAALSVMPAVAQTVDPPAVPLWAKAENGDAIQRDLGFILPAKWRSFERKGFTSTRADGASTKIWYADEARGMRMHILLQLRPDVRGMKLPPDMVWSILQVSAKAEYFQRTQDEPVELATGPFRTRGSKGPAGRMRLVRYALPEGSEVQGFWAWNIGVWTVVLTVSGPESRRAEIEAEGKAVLDQMPFPSAPSTAELLTLTDADLQALPACPNLPAGAGEEVKADAGAAMVLGTMLTSYLLGDAEFAPPTPVTHRDRYCRVESFESGGRKVVALAASNLDGTHWSARYGFVVDRGEFGYFQVERTKALGETATANKQPELTKAVHLDFGNRREVRALTLWSDWPSYPEARKMVERAIAGGIAPVVSVAMPPSQTLVQINPARIMKTL